MITKGQIITVNSDNTLDVRIPIFEAASDSRNNQVIKCTVCYNPGNLNSYKVNDVVFVAFEDNQIDKPVVIGKLYMGEEKEASNHSFSNSLTVTENASLPVDTTIGNVSFKQFKGLFEQGTQLNDFINQLDKSTEAINNEIDEIQEEISQIEPVQIIDLRS